MRDAEIGLLAEGHFDAVAHIDVNGDAQGLNVFSSPNGDVSKAVGKIVFDTKFKPGSCAGNPCEMDFPIRFDLKVTERERYLAACDQQVQAEVEYPHLAQERGEQGTARFRIIVERNGIISSATLIESSGSIFLDHESKAVFDRIKSFKPWPKELAGDNLCLLLPIQFAFH